MRIIGKTKETEIQCHICKSKLAYMDKDLKERQTGMYIYRFITCPVCHNEILTETR